ncbi:30S ribosomal protein S6 [Candidatus Parcubacteria bacterium]|nr:MAG: 30S ribosomal protein S6 [Candidatus Parcubacteria bacterium]
MDEQDKKSYEVAFLAKTEETLGSVLRLVEQHQGEITSEASSKRVALAYPIKKEGQAVFGFLHAKLAPESAKALERNLETNQEVLRFLIMKLPSPKVLAASAPRSPFKARPLSRSMPEVRRQPTPLSNEALEKKIEEISQ